MPDTSTPTEPSSEALSLTPAKPSTVQSIYFNGFSMGLSSADIVILLNLEQTEILQLRMSFTVAKTLAQKLTETVAKFEKLTEHTLMTTEDVFKALQKAGIKKP